MTPPRPPSPVRGDSSIGVRLRLQTLAGPLQVLAVASLAQSRSDANSFTTREVADLYTELRIPPPANLSSVLGRLRSQRDVMNPAAGFWSLTPSGEHRLASDAGHVRAVELSDSLNEPRGTTFGERRHATIPPFLGPDGASDGLKSILEQSPFEQNVMLITRFPKDDEDHFGGLIGDIRTAVAEHGLVLHVASDGNAKDTLWENVVTYMWACKYAIVLMDTADGAFNSNVLIEVGGMLMTGRRCAIIRDESVPAMPSDLVGHIYKSTKLKDHGSTIQVVHDWIENDLGLS